MRGAKSEARKPKGREKNGFEKYFVLLDSLKSVFKHAPQAVVKIGDI